MLIWEALILTLAAGIGLACCVCVCLKDDESCKPEEKNDVPN